MVEIGGKPILWHIMKIYSAHGVNDFVICCGYKGYVIKEYFANYFLHMSDVTFDMARQQHGSASAEGRAVARDAGRHRRGHHDRRPPQARRATTSRTKRRSASPMATASAISTSARRSTSTAATASWRPSPRCSRPAATARWSVEGDAVTRLHRKAARRRRLDQRRLLRAVAACLDLIEGDDSELGERAARPARREGQLMAFEHAGFWQPMDTLARQEHAGGAVGIGQGALEDLAMTGRHPTHLLARQARPAHRPYRLQGRLAGAVAATGSAPRLTGIGLPPPTTPNLYADGRDRRDCATAASLRHSRCRERSPSSIRAAQPEIVLHLAAQPLVRASYREPLATFDDQRHGHGASARRAARTSTRARRGRGHDRQGLSRTSSSRWPYREDGRARRPRSLQRQQGCRRDGHRELSRCVSRGRRASRWRSARAGNVIGGGDWSEDRLIPDAVRAWQARRSRSTVRRPAGGAALAARAGAARRLSALAERLWAKRRRWPAPIISGRRRRRRAQCPRRGRAGAHRLWRAARCVWGDGNEGPHEAGWLALEAAKAAHLLGVAPRWTLADAVRRTMAWYRGQQDGSGGARALCAGISRDFEAAAAPGCPA